MTPHRILVVDDDEPTRRYVGYALEMLHCEILKACDANHALKLAHDYCFNIDLVITDIRMPRIDGIELARLLRKQAPHIKILFMSGHAAVPELDHEAFIAKGFDFASITSKVSELLQPCSDNP